MIEQGARVYLKTCQFGEPGTVMTHKRGKIMVYWPGIDFLGKHRPESLEIATAHQERKSR
jgi:hypothetical protein